MDVEKTMQFILEQNAVNTVQIAQLREMVLAHESDLKDHESDLQTHAEWKLGMSQALQDLAVQMKTGFGIMSDKHAEIADKHSKLEDKVAEIAESLHILIRTVQDMIPRLPRE
jgi:hypothetical protein